MRYYQIIPLINLKTKKSQFFTYQSKEKLLNGSLLQIPFGSKQIKGIVLSQTTKPPFSTKSVGKLLFNALLSTQQIEFAQKISDYYFSSLGTVIKFFLPPIGKKISRATIIQEKNRELGPTLTPEQKKALKEIRQSQLPVLLYGPPSSGKTEIIMKLIENNLTNNRQSLVLIPEIFLAHQEIQRYRKRFGNQKVGWLHSDLKNSEFFHIWQGIKNGKIKVIISTRVGIFAPFKKLGLIAIDEEQDPSHKQWDQLPRFHTRQLAELLAKNNKIKIILISATPSIESYQLTKIKKIKLVKIPQLKSALTSHPPTTKIIDLRPIFFKRSKQPLLLSDELLNNLSENLKKKALSLIFISRRGKSRSVLCQDCKKILRCPNCDTPIVQIGDNFKCLHCNYKISQFSHCQYCGGIKLKNLGFGTEKAWEILQSIYPKAKIALADQETFKNKKRRQELFEKLQAQKIDILVGSSMIIKGFDFPQVGLVALLNAENWSGKNDFRFDERWLGNIFQLCGRLNRPQSPHQGIAIIQTFNPSNPLFIYLEKFDWLGFLDYELSNRQILRFPPYSRLIRLTCQNNSQKNVDKNSQLMYNLILKSCRGEILSVTKPYYGRLKKIRKNWQKNLLIKTDSLNKTSLKKLLNNLPPGWIIDIDPENIF